MKQNFLTNNRKITNRKIGIIILLVILFWLCFGIIIWLSTSYFLNLPLSIYNPNPLHTRDIRDSIRIVINYILSILLIIHFLLVFINIILWLVCKFKKYPTLKVKLIFFLTLLGIFLLSILWTIQSYRLQIPCCPPI